MARTLFIQLSRLGDCLQSTLLLAAWRKRNPEDHISVLTHAAYQSVFEGSPDVNEVTTYAPPLDVVRDPDRNPIERLAGVETWLSHLREKRFDCVVNLTHDALSCWIMAALGSPKIRGLSIDSEGKTCARDPWSLYILSLLRFRGQNLFNLADAYVHLSGGASVRERPQYTIPDQSRKDADAWLRHCAGKCLVGFQPGANKPERRWPVNNFIRLGQQLASSHNARILIFGTRDEGHLARTIADALPGSLDFAGRTTIPQLAALLERCRILVTNDTGTMHLAAAVGTRIVALFESSAYLRETGPYGPGHWILQSRELREYGERGEEELRQIARIPVEEVARAVGSLLGQDPRGEPDGSRLGDGPQPQVDHFRSVWSNGHLDFYPVFSAELGPPTLVAYLQKPIWLASLDGYELNASRAASECLELVQHHYSLPSSSFLDETLEEIRKQESDLNAVLRKMKNPLQSILERLRRNPNYVVPQKQVDELTGLESRMLEFNNRSAVQPFVAYFETGLAMVEGDTTRRYLQSYLRPVLLLEKQLQMFRSLLQSVPALLHGPG